MKFAFSRFATVKFALSRFATAKVHYFYLTNKPPPKNLHISRELTNFFIAKLIQCQFKIQALKAIVSLGIAYFVCMSSIDYSFEKMGYADGPISSASMPYFKFHKGFGGVVDPPVQQFKSLNDYNQWEKEEVKKAIVKDTRETAFYVLTKMIRYLGFFDYKVEMTYNHDEAIWNKGAIKRCIMFGWGQYIMLIILALIYFLKNRESNFITPVYIFYIGITLVYFLIEAFTSYRYESYPYLMIFACSSPYVSEFFSKKRLGHNSKE